MNAQEKRPTFLKENETAKRIHCLALYKFQNLIGVSEMDETDIDAYLSKYPEAKKALMALLMMASGNIEGKHDATAWECDFKEVIWNEVKRNKKPQNERN